MVHQVCLISQSTNEITNVLLQWHEVANNDRGSPPATAIVQRSKRTLDVGNKSEHLEMLDSAETTIQPTSIAHPKDADMQEVLGAFSPDI
ncbi:hypothetical protein VTL71DRAFT_12553, partial [Oculimacula yallundae]